MVSVVIPNLNGAATLGEQLEALTAQTYTGEWEVIVADNGSTDESAEVVEAWEGHLPGLRVVDASRRKGINHARNRGFESAKGDFIVFCDNDDIVAPRWVEALAGAAARLDLVGGWQDHETLNDTGTWAFAPYRVSTRPPTSDDSLTIAFGFLPFVVGCSCGVRASVLRQLGGFNEDYIIGCDDIEFSWRAALAGYRLGFAPEAVIQYRWRHGYRAVARQVARWGMEEARLYRDFKGAGMARDTTSAVIGDWAWIILHVVNLVRPPAHRGAWVRRAARRWGHIRGGIRYRVFYP
jgi:GT2 family glycosyltransferase